MNYIFISGILNSALYLSGVFILGITQDKPLASILAVITTAVCYLSAVVQVSAHPESRFFRIVAIALVVWSIIVGAAAGIVLLL